MRRALRNQCFGGKVLDAMNIVCYCGAVIIDSTDYVPHKGHLIPDQNWFDTYDRVDEIIDRVTAGQITTEDAYWQARLAIGESARMVYECGECGRLFIDDRQRNLQCYVPEKQESSKEILRSKEA
jgi:hypothetical protein